MDPKAIYKYCKKLGCCEACCLRYIGIKNPNAYENLTNFVTKYQDDADAQSSSATGPNTVNDYNMEGIDTEENLLNVSKSEHSQNINGDSYDDNKVNGADINLPPCKKKRLEVCVSCLGVLQECNWIESYVMVKEVLFKKRYECTTFACGLSSPIAALLRERAITLLLAEEFPGYDHKILTPLKEAWKWSFGVKLAVEIDKSLDSGAVSPLLVTLHYDYADELQELEILKQVSPQLFEERSKQKRRFVTEFTRRSVEQALATASLRALRAAGGALPAAGARAACVGAACTHAPAYLAGRYIKLSRNLPQTPWVLDGKRMLPSSVQEIIYKPLADFYDLDADQAERRLKLIAAGREDVDVRCLGDGRPFALEITDPPRQLRADELAKACEEISRSGEVVVKLMVPITKEDLIQLKKGEETKSKTYEALCIKLSHSKYEDVPENCPIRVTAEDIERINSFRNTPLKPQLPQNTDESLTRADHSKSSLNVVQNSINLENARDIANISEVKRKDKDNIDDGVKPVPNIPLLRETNSPDVKESTSVKAQNGKALDKSEDKTIVAEMSTSVNDDDDMVKQTVMNKVDTLNGAEKNKSYEQPENIKVRTVNRDDNDIVDTPDSGQTTTIDYLNRAFGDIKDSGRDVLESSEEVPETDSSSDVKITIQQKTPIRVLHRRPLLTRTRHILELKATAVPEHPQLFRVRVRTSAGTYVKEWAHGELGRSRPALRDALGARADLVALDVTAVHLKWPPQ